MEAGFALATRQNTGMDRTSGLTPVWASFRGAAAAKSRQVPLVQMRIYGRGAGTVPGQSGAIPLSSMGAGEFTANRYAA